jgi:hypothetical protein
MSSEISLTADYVKSLEEKNVGLSVPYYKLKEWFAKNKKIFFDCEKPDKSSCLQLILEKSDISAFKIFFIVKENESYRLMDVSFRNLGKETLEHFIERYERQLKSMTKLGLQSRKIEYVETVGYSYEV